MFAGYPLWKWFLVEALILSVAGIHALLLSVHGTTRTQRAVDGTMNVLGKVVLVSFIGCAIVLLSGLVTAWLLKSLATQSEFNIKVILELSVQLFGLLSLANIFLPILAKDFRTGLWLNISAVVFLVLGAGAGNLFKLYVAEKNFQGFGPVVSAIWFVTSFFAICALLGYATWIARRRPRQAITQGDSP